MNLGIIITYRVADKIQISPVDLIYEWAFGIPLQDKFGNQYSMKDIKKKILSAQTVLSKLITMKMTPEMFGDIQDYFQEEFAMYGHIKLNYEPNRDINNKPKIQTILVGSQEYGLEGFYNSVSTVKYPLQWITIKGKSLSLIPGTEGSPGVIVTASGNLYPNIMGGLRFVPDFWHISYEIGFWIIPDDIRSVIAKMSILMLFNIIGDVLRDVGISSQTLGIDGLTQSYSTVQNADANILSPRIKQYQRELFGDGRMDCGDIERLRGAYHGISFEVV